jgi:hypothetical protein
MSGFLNSIVRGAGMSIGRNLVGDFGRRKETPKKSVYNSNELECWSHKGYEENDVEFTYDAGSNWNRQYIKWYMWILSIFNGLLFITPLFYISNVYNVFFKKHQIHFYTFKWNTYKVSDRRSKSGVREIKNLDMVYDKSVSNPPYLRTKIETMLEFLLVSWFPITILIYNLTK